MKILAGVDNLKKEFDYIVRIDDYQENEHGDYIITKYKILHGNPWPDENGNIYGFKNLVQEDSELIQGIFEHLHIGNIWTWY